MMYLLNTDQKVEILTLKYNFFEVIEFCSKEKNYQIPQLKSVFEAFFLEMLYEMSIPSPANPLKTHLVESLTY